MGGAWCLALGASCLGPLGGFGGIVCAGGARSPEPSLIWAPRNMAAVLDTLCSEALGIMDETCQAKKKGLPLQLPVSLNAKSATL